MSHMKQRITEICLWIQNNKGNLYDRINELLFYIIFMGFATYVPLVTCNLIFIEDAEYYFYRLDKIHWGYNVLMVLLLVKILLQKNSFKEWCVIGILTAISRLSFEQSGEHYMVLILIFAVILGYYIFIPEKREEMIGDKNINENQTA